MSSIINPQDVWLDSGNPGHEINGNDVRRELFQPGDNDAEMLQANSDDSDDEMRDINFTGWASEHHYATPASQIQASCSPTPEATCQSPHPRGAEVCLLGIAETNS